VKSPKPSCHLERRAALCRRSTYKQKIGLKASRYWDPLLCCYFELSEKSCGDQFTGKLTVGKEFS
jgi:hypothetical protein